MKNAAENPLFLFRRAAAPLLLWLAAGVAPAQREFNVEGAPSEALGRSVVAAAEQARDRLAERWPEPLDDRTLRLVWHASSDAMAEAVGRRVDGVLALADKSRDVVLLNGPALRRAGGGALERTLRHELVHIHFGRQKVPEMPRWLEEGLAMRLADEVRWGDSLRLAADRVFGTEDDPVVLWSRWPDAPRAESRAYRQASAMTEHFIDNEFPEGGERRLLQHLLHKTRGPILIRNLWRPEVRRPLYDRWRAETPSVGALIYLLTAPTVLLGLAGLLLVYAWWRKRARGQAVREAWADEGPYFGAPATPDEEAEADDDFWMGEDEED